MTGCNRRILNLEPSILYSKQYTINSEDGVWVWPKPQTLTPDSHSLTTNSEVEDPLGGASRDTPFIRFWQPPLLNIVLLLPL